MKVEIRDKTYNGDLLPFIGDLRLLKKEFGFGYSVVVEQMNRLFVSGEDFNKLADEEEWVEAFVAWLWMLLLRNGERSTTRADVELIPVNEVEIIPDQPIDEGEPPDPTSAPTDSDPGAEKAKPAAKQRTRASTKTSKNKSQRD